MYGVLYHSLFPRIGVFSVFIVLGFIIAGFALRYLVEYWGSYLQKKRVKIPFIVAGIGGIFLINFIIPAAIITWIASYVITNEYYH